MWMRCETNRLLDRGIIKIVKQKAKILTKRLGHSPVALIGVHDCGEDVLFTAYDFDSGFIGISVKLFCEIISSVVEKIGRVHIEDQFSIAERPAPQQPHLRA